MKSPNPSREISDAWLCGDAVEWKPVGRASEFVLATSKDPELKAGRLAACAAGCGLLASAPFGAGIATICLGAAGYGAGYLVATLVSLRARSEAYRRLARAGFQWRSRVEALGGHADARLMRRIGIEHDVALAVEASEAWERDQGRDPEARASSAMGSLCLAAATAWADLTGAGKWARQARAEARSRVDGADAGRQLFPMELARIEGAQIESSMSGREAGRSGPKRM